MLTYKQIFIGTVVAIPVLLALIFGIIELVKPTKTLEYYKREVEKSLDSLALSGKRLIDYANEYVSRKTGLESGILPLLNNSNTILTNVIRFRDTCSGNFSDLNNILSQATADSNNSRNQLTLSNTSLTNIQNIVNEITPIPTGSPSVDFANSLNSIESLRNRILSNHNTVQALINSISSNYINAIQTQQTISNNLSRAYSASNDLIKYVTSLNSSLKTTDEYIRVLNSVSKSKLLLTQLNSIRTTLNTSSEFYSQINSLYNTLNNQINTVQPYLDNVLTVFSAATKDSNVTLNSYINQLNVLFSSVASLIGIINATNTQTPTPFPSPYSISTLPPGQFSINYFYTNSNTIIVNIVSQYNIIIDNYNKIVGNINTLNRLTNTSTSDINLNINNLNQSLLNAQAILKNYFPGSTTPGIINNNPPVQVTPLPTVTPLVVSTLPPITQFLPTNVKSYINPGTFTYTVQRTGPHFIELWGGGQSGEQSTLRSGGNGGAGGWYSSRYITLDQGTILNIIVGSGGTGNLGNGGITSVNGQSISIIASGGGITNGGDIQGTAGGQKGSYNGSTQANSGLSFSNYSGINAPGNGGGNTGGGFVGAGGGGGIAWLGIGNGGKGGNSVAINNGTGGSGGGGSGYSVGGEGGFIAPQVGISPGGNGGNGAVFIEY